MLMAEETFAVTYRGPALADGRIPVRQLAPALAALGELFAEASTTVYPERPAAQLEVGATRKGSFDVEFILTVAEGAWDTTNQIFGSDAASALSNLIEIVGGGSGLFAFIKWLRGRQIKAEEKGSDSGQTKVVVEGDAIEIPVEVLKLHKQARVRRSAREVVRPLGRDGVERLEVRRDEEVAVDVGEGDVAAFEAVEEIEDGEAVEYSERETVLHIDNIAWKEGNKWRVSEGTGAGSFWVTISDPSFLAGIEKAAESFVKGDMLKCRLRVRQSVREGKLRAQYEISDVIEHIRAGVQLPLEAAEGGEDD